jgi:parallel beta-helix repeat protein
LGDAAVRKISAVAISFLLILTLIIGIDMHINIARPARGSVIYVGGGGVGNYSTIQEGIDAANPGDTVFVYNGTYPERIKINKTLNLMGENRSNAIIFAPSVMMKSSDVIQVTADWVNITGLSIMNAQRGINVGGFANGTISDNIISYNGEDGIYGGPTHWIITNNNIHTNGWAGINLGIPLITNEHANNIVFGNILQNNNQSGITLDGTSGNQVYNNILIKNGWGIYSHHGKSNNISNNYISSNSDGIYLRHNDHWNNITGNTIEGNNYGIYLFDDMQNNTIVYNNILNNDNGIYILDGAPIYDNYIHHNNFINNTNQSRDWGNPYGQNYFDDSYPSGGNFWSNYNGSDFYSGPNQDILGSDGIGDTPYVFNFSQDNYPLTEPWGTFTYLRQGWNPISISRIQFNTKLEDVLSQINGTYRAVQWFNASDKQDPWKHHSISKPSKLNDLNEINHTMGLQIYVDDPGGAILDFSGIIPSQNQTIPLHKGWNMVGYPSLSNKFRPDALNNLVFGTEVDAVWTYNSGAQKWEEVGDLNYFLVGKGYWIHATEDCVWEGPL